MTFDLGAPGPETTGRRPVDSDESGLQDPRLAQAIAALMANVTISPEGHAIDGAGAAGPIMDAVYLFSELHDAYPFSKYLHYAWAAALSVAVQGKTADAALTACIQSHPGFWLAQATKTQKALISWNPFYLPECTPLPGMPVHPFIEHVATGQVLMAIRQGVVPRAAIFLRDDDDDLDVATFTACPAAFTTLISAISNPQVVAIYGRLEDDPVDPYLIDLLQCPLRPFGAPARLPYELFIRQTSFEVVVLDGAGVVKSLRTITPSSRMKATHARLAQMFETTSGPKLSAAEISKAVKRHQDKYPLGSIEY